MVILCIPLNVLDVANHKLKNSVLLTTSSVHKKWGDIINICFRNIKLGVKIWFEKGHWRLACEAILLMVPLIPLQVAFPSSVAKNSIQPGCGSCFDDEISGLLSFLSSSIVLLSHNWNKRLCAEMEIHYWCKVHKSFLKTIHCHCVRSLVVTSGCIKFMGKFTASIYII